MQTLKPRQKVLRVYPGGKKLDTVAFATCQNFHERQRSGLCRLKLRTISTQRCWGSVICLMAEARHEEEGELKDASVMRNRNQATGKKYTSVDRPKTPGWKNILNALVWEYKRAIVQRVCRFWYCLNKKSDHGEMFFLSSCLSGTSLKSMTLS